MVTLVVTIVVLLILAGITIMYILGNNSIFKQASEAKLKTEIAKAREKLETVLTTVHIEKRTNKKYDEDEFLDEYILNNVQGSEIIEEIVIVDNYAFSLDRSVPKIGEYIGQKKDLVFPTIHVSTPTLTSDKKFATFTITASESKNGINKIEVIQEGQAIETYEYSNRKDEIQETYTAKQNGTYVIKVHSNLYVKGIAKVEGIISSISFEPNGSEEYKKEHSTTITVTEQLEKAKSIKYLWSNTTAEPDDSSFNTECKNGDTIQKNGITGTYYIWVLLETEKGNKSKWRSEGFNFDNEGPTISSFTATKYSENGITLSATAKDTGTGVTKFEFYVDNVLKGTQTCSATTSSVTKSKTITGLSTGNHTCKVIVYDANNNNNNNIKSGSTKLYYWKKWSSDPVKEYQEKRSEPYMCTKSVGSSFSCSEYSFDKEQQKFYCDGFFKTTSEYSFGKGFVFYYKESTEKYYSNLTLQTGASTPNGGGSYTFEAVDLSVEEKIIRYDKGSTYYGEISATSLSRYPRPGGNSTGYYEYIGIK